MHLTKNVILMTELPEEALKRAQVLIVEGERWHALGPAPWRAHGEWGVEEVKRMVRCPIVEIPEDITEEADRRMGEIVRACTDKSCGVFNLSGLLTGLEALGARRLTIDD